MVLALVYAPFGANAKVFDIKEAQKWDLDSLYFVAFENIGANTEESRKECNKYYKAALYLKDTSSLAYAYDLKGQDAYFANYIDSAFYFSELAIDFFTELNDSLGLSAAYFNRGLYHSYRGEYNTSLRYFNAGRDIEIVFGLQSESDLFFYDQVSQILFEQGQMDMALRYLQRAWNAFYKADDYYEYYNTDLHLSSAWLYHEIGVSEMAVYHAELAYSRTKPDSAIIARSDALEVLALEAARNGDSQTAFSYARNAQKLVEDYGDSYFIAYNHIILIELYLSLNMVSSAQPSFEYLKNIGDLFTESPSFLADKNEVLYQYSKATNNSEEALVYLELFLKMKKSMSEFDGVAAMSQFDEEMEAKERALVNTQLLLNGKEIREQRLYIIGGVILVIGFTVFVIFLVLSNRRKDRSNLKLRASNDLIEKQRKEIIQQKDILEVSNEKLEILNKSKDRLFSILAHDLRQPFNQILGIIDLIELGALEEEDKIQLHKDLKSSVQSTSDLVNNMLLWSKAQFAGVSLNTVDIELSEALKRNLLYYSVAFKKKSIKVSFEVPDDIIIRFDSDHFESVMRNILSNAYKFSPANSTIYIMAEQYDHERVCLKVKDEGIGMDQYQIEHILKGKGGLSAAGTYNESGVGIGMVIVKDFLAENNALLEIESVINEGSTFCINVPSAQKKRVNNPST